MFRSMICSLAEKLIQNLKNKNHEVVTEVTEASTFRKAEGKHQQYYTQAGQVLTATDI